MEKMSTLSAINDQVVNFGLERLIFCTCYIFRRKFENDYNLQINIMCSSLMFNFVLNVLAMIDVIISHSVFLSLFLNSTLKATVCEILPFYQ